MIALLETQLSKLRSQLTFYLTLYSNSQIVPSNLTSEVLKQHHRSSNISPTVCFINKYGNEIKKPGLPAVSTLMGFLFFQNKVNLFLNVCWVWICRQNSFFSGSLKNILLALPEVPVCAVDNQIRAFFIKCQKANGTSTSNNLFCARVCSATVTNASYLLIAQMCVYVF